jgi:hypothetical protein
MLKLTTQTYNDIIAYANKHYSKYKWEVKHYPSDCGAYEQMMLIATAKKQQPVHKSAKLYQHFTSRPTGKWNDVAINIMATDTELFSLFFFPNKATRMANGLPE